MTPLVLQHGLFGFGEFAVGNFKLSYFNGIDRAFERRGHPLIVARVHPTGSIALRAKQLKTTILKQLRAAGRPKKERVVIFAHSMGGLDSRYMIAKLGMADRVSALVTISTPHRGSPYADWCLLNVGKRLGGLRLMKLIGWDVAAVSDLTIEACAAFNEEIRDVDGVKYFSISAARPWHRIAPMFLHSYKIIHAREGDNDGLVSVASAAWGEHAGTWPADHLHVINKRIAPEVLPGKTGNITPRYLKLLDRLCEEGLCESSCFPAKMHEAGGD